MRLNQFSELCSPAFVAFLFLQCIVNVSAGTHHHLTTYEIPSANGDEDVVKALFTERQQMDPSMAYETSFFKDLVVRQKSDNKKLEHQDDIKKLNEELSRLEAEKAKGENPKLVEKEKKILQEKAHYEIQDAAVLSYYTQSEYDDLTVKVSEAYAKEKNRIETRKVIFDQIQDLFAQSEKQMKDASETMASGYSMKDEIERANNGRKAFAMEALGIEQMNQILEIIGQLDMLLQYSDEQLKEMIEGKPAGEPRGTVTLIEKPQETIDVTLSEPVADVVKVQVSEPVVTEEFKKSEPAEAKVEMAVLPVTVSSKSKVETKEQPKEKPEPKPIVKAKEVRSTGTRNVHECRSVKTTEGTYFAVQVGSFKKELSNVSAYKKLTSLYLDDTDGIHFRYVTGQFTNLDEAFEFAMDLHSKGFPDAFVVAISEGERSTIQHAKEVLGQSTR